MDQIKKYIGILNKIVPRILKITKKHQKGLGRMDFTEGWFRKSGLYELEEDYQNKVFDNFTVNKINQSKNARLFLNNRKIFTQVLEKVKVHQKCCANSKFTHVNIYFIKGYLKKSD